MDGYYPNACSVCFETKNIKRCSRCQMISYCSLNHQRKDWHEHRSICGVISAMMKERGVSHLFEKLRGADYSTWIRDRMLMTKEAESRLGRKLDANEIFLFKFPRACFICHESKQNLLKSCPDCPGVSFCTEHPSSPIHDEDCAKMKETLDLLKRNDNDTQSVHRAISFILEAYRNFDSSKLPTTMKEFMFEFPNSSSLSKDVRLILTELFSVVLTLFSSLKKLRFTPGSTLTLHVFNDNQCAHAWELLLHLFPNVKFLRIILIVCYVPESEGPLMLCRDCRNKGKQIYVDFLESFDYCKFVFSRNYREPDALMDCDLTLSDEPKIFHKMSFYNCPYIITVKTENEYNVIKKVLEKTKVFSSGSNAFKALVNYRVDDRLVSSNEYMFILKCQRDLRQHFTKASESEENSTKASHTFYASYCFVCRDSKARVTCKRCKMISYCAEYHQDEHQAEHKNLCRAILGILNETGAPNLFDKLKTEDSNLWLKTKLRLMSRVRTKLGRELADFEKQMFLFPKTCFICHESDSSVLKNCKCGVFLCTIHKNHQEHKNLCQNLSLAFKLTSKERPKIPIAVIKIISLTGKSDKYISMQTFIDSFLYFDARLFDQENYFVSDYLTKPFTFLWSLEKLNYNVESKLIVHVIGATNTEVATQQYWKLVLFHFQKLMTLKLIFIGPEISNVPLMENGLEFEKSLFTGKNIEVETHALKYEEYFQSESFVKPNFVIGFNLHLHETELGINNYNWREMISTLREINAPFILTAGSESRARKDHETLSRLLETTVDFNCFEKNPFAGLCPERDFETERLLFSNQYVVIYDEGKLSKLKISDNSKLGPHIENNDKILTEKTNNSQNGEKEEKSKVKEEEEK